MPYDPNELTVAQIRKTAAFAANANTTAVDLKDYVGKVAVIFNIGDNTAGTNPTYDARIETGAESNGANSANITDDDGANIAITQSTGTGGTQTLYVDTRKAAKYLKVVQTIGGTDSPSFPVGITLVGKKQSET